MRATTEVLPKPKFSEGKIFFDLSRTLWFRGFRSRGREKFEIDVGERREREREREREGERENFCDLLGAALLKGERIPLNVCTGAYLELPQ